MTASRALRNTGRVSAETRERVLASARVVGYRPNPLVQTFMAGVRRQRVESTANLGWVTTEPKPKPAHKFIREGARDRAAELGFGLEEILISTEQDAGSAEARATKHGRILRARGVVGAVIAPLAEPGGIDFPWSQMPVAAVGRSLLAPSLHYVMAHFYRMMDQIIAELLKRGYRRIAFLNTREMDARSEQAPLSRFSPHVAESRDDLMLTTTFCDDWEDDDFRALLKHTQPDAVVGIYAQMHEQLQRAGARIPKKVGFVTLSWSEMHPHCAGIRHPWEAIGAGAVDMVVAQLHRNERGIPARPKAMLFEGDWVEGNTLRPRLSSKAVTATA